MTDCVDAQRHLVIVADDGGVDAARNHGIVAASARGVVRAVSVLATGDAVADLAKTYHAWPGPNPRPDVGLHLNLTEGRAASSALVGTLVRDGRFYRSKDELLRDAQTHPLDIAAVELEARAQLERLLDLGLPVSFANGHQHCHLFPGAAAGLSRALDAHPCIRWVRCGGDVVSGAAPGASSSWPEIDADQLDALQRDRQQAGWSAEVAFEALSHPCRGLRESGRRGADAFVGLDLIGDFTHDRLLERLRRARDVVGSGGVVEVMTHPGVADEHSVPFSALDCRSEECRVLTDPELPGELAAAGFTLSRFTDVPA